MRGCESFERGKGLRDSGGFGEPGTEIVLGVVFSSIVVGRRRRCVRVRVCGLRAHNARHVSVCLWNLQSADG